MDIKWDRIQKEVISAQSVLTSSRRVRVDFYRGCREVGRGLAVGGDRRRSTLCLRSVHLPLRWLHPAEGSFLGTEGNGPDWVGNDSGWVGLRDAGGGWLWRISGGRLVTQGKSTGRWFAGGRLWIGLVFRGLRGKWEGRGCFRDKKEAPLSSVVSGASGNFWLFQGSQVRHWKPVRSGCGLRF